MDRTLRLGISVLVLLASTSCAAPAARVRPADVPVRQETAAEPAGAEVTPTEPQVQTQPVAAPSSADTLGAAAVDGDGTPEAPEQPLAAPPEVPGRQIKLAQQSPALTETLSQVLGMLEKEKAENERLRREVAALGQQLAEKDRTIAQLTLERDAFTEQLQTLEGSLGKWKQDVLGFRDEMRQAEEAEIEVLQQILLILKSFQKEGVPQ